MVFGRKKKKKDEFEKVEFDNIGELDGETIDDLKEIDESIQEKPEIETRREKKINKDLSKIDEKLAELEQLKKEVQEQDEEEEVEEDEPPVIKAKSREVIQVVKELPMQPVRRVKEDDGTIVNIVTIEEALTAIMNNK